LAKLTGEAMFWEKAEKIMEILDNNKPQDGLVPIYVHPDTGKYQGSLIRLGSRGDSYYEYLLKQHLQTKEQVYWDMYRESVAGVQKHLVRKTAKSGLTFIGELEHGIGGPLSPKMAHLVCFYGGLLAVGATNGLTYQEAKKQPFWNEERESHFKLGEELTYTCYRMYKDVPTGLSPEIVVFNEEDNGQADFFIKPLDRHNLHRPETVESLFYLYRLTGDNKYREYGYEIFQSFVKHTKVTNNQGEVSYTSLADVTQIHQESETTLSRFGLLRPSSICISSLTKLTRFHLTNTSSIPRHIHSQCSTLNHLRRDGEGNLRKLDRKSRRKLTKSATRNHRKQLLLTSPWKNRKRKL